MRDRDRDRDRRVTWTAFAILAMFHILNKQLSQIQRKDFVRDLLQSAQVDSTTASYRQPQGEGASWRDGRSSKISAFNVSIDYPI